MRQGVTRASCSRLVSPASHRQVAEECQQNRPCLTCNTCLTRKSTIAEFAVTRPSTRRRSRPPIAPRWLPISHPHLPASADRFCSVALGKQITDAPDSSGGVRGHAKRNEGKPIFGESTYALLSLAGMAPRRNRLRDAVATRVDDPVSTLGNSSASHKRFRLTGP